MIRLIKYEPEWKSTFDLEKKKIANKIPGLNRIVHFGSTSIPGSYAKPVIDIAIITEELNEGFKYISSLVKIGYNRRVHVLPDRICLTKGKPKTINLYLIPNNSATLKNWLQVKNVLSSNMSLLVEYNELKKEILNSGITNIRDYTNKKSEFINKIILDYDIQY